jgi:hypothetical protein
METPDLGLSSKEMVVLLLEGKKITLEFETLLDFERCASNLNTEKSRSKKAHEDFGLEFSNKIIKIETEEVTYPGKITFYCIDPTPPKKYAVFSISD